MTAETATAQLTVRRDALAQLPRSEPLNDDRLTFVTTTEAIFLPNLGLPHEVQARSMRIRPTRPGEPSQRIIL